MLKLDCSRVYSSATTPDIGTVSLPPAFSALRHIRIFVVFTTSVSFSINWQLDYLRAAAVAVLTFTLTPISQSSITSLLHIGLHILNFYENAQIISSESVHKQTNKHNNSTTARTDTAGNHVF